MPTVVPAVFGDPSDQFHPTNNGFSGHHEFPNGGCFEVFYSNQFEMSVSPDDDVGCSEPGWYWWPCFPGCMPEDAPTGPFPTAEGAYLDAMGE